MARRAVLTARYAIAVRDNADLWLFVVATRGSHGDVYSFRPIDEGRRNPHASYHASGVTHHKSYNKVSMRRMRQKLDATFIGAEWLDGSPISLQGARILRKPCRPERYAGVFEIDASEISPTYENCYTSINIDLVAPGHPPIPSGIELRRIIFTDRVPHLLMTLWDQRKMFENIASASKG